MSSLVFGRAPLLAQYIIDTANSSAHAFSLATRLQQALVPAELRDATLLAGLPDLELALKKHEALLGESSRLPNATADTIVEAVISAVTAIALATNDISSNGTLGGPDGTGSVTGQLATQQALLHPHFLALVTALAPLKATTGSERRNILLLAARSQCVIAIQVLVAGTRALARLHPELGKILDSRSELPTYFGKAMTIDLTHPFAIPDRWSTFTWTGERGDSVYAMGLFLNLAFRSIDYMNGPVGINALRALMLGPNMNRSYTNPLDFYTVPHGVTYLCAMLHRLLCAIGAPDTVSPTIGFTMITWGVFYVAHIWRACELGSLEEQIQWLDFAANQFCVLLSVVEDQVRQWIYSTQPGTAFLATIAPIDCPPAVALRNAGVDLDAVNVACDRRSWGVIERPKGTPPLVDELPKLSAYPQQVVHYQPPASAETPSAAAKRPLAGPKTPAAPKVPKTAPTPPGGLADTWTWLTHHKSLLLGTTVWNVAAIVKDLKIANAEKLCWAMLLSMRTGDNLRALYAAGNKAADAFVLHPLVTPGKALFREKYARLATPEERKKVTQKPPDPRKKAKAPHFRRSA